MLYVASRPIRKERDYQPPPSPGANAAMPSTAVAIDPGSGVQVGAKATPLKFESTGAPASCVKDPHELWLLRSHRLFRREMRGPYRQVFIGCKQLHLIAHNEPVRPYNPAPLVSCGFAALFATRFRPAEIESGLRRH